MLNYLRYLSNKVKERIHLRQLKVYCPVCGQEFSKLHKKAGKICNCSCKQYSFYVVEGAGLYSDTFHYNGSTVYNWYYDNDAKSSILLGGKTIKKFNHLFPYTEDNLKKIDKWVMFS